MAQDNGIAHASQALTLSAAQERIIARVAEWLADPNGKLIFFLSGEPDAGLRTSLRVFLDRNPHLAAVFAASTGRGAQSLAARMNRPASTVYRMLYKAAPGGNVILQPTPELVAADFIVIANAELLSHAEVKGLMATGKRLLLLGDHLFPPVSGGMTVFDECGITPDVRLDHSMVPTPVQDAMLDTIDAWLSTTARKPYLLVCGAAGTGLKTVLRFYLDRRDDLRILLTAPTAKEARSLSPHLIRPVKSLHRLLYQPKPDNPYALREAPELATADLVVVAAAEMLDKALMCDLLATGRPVLLLGDDTRAPLPDCRPFIEGRMPDMRLTHVLRQRL